MKTFITLLLIAGVVICTANVLVHAGQNSFYIEFEENSSNSSNVDVTIGVTFGNTSTPLSNDNYVQGICIDTAVANHTLSAASTTLNAWSIEWQCHSTCTSLFAIGNGTAGTAFYTTPAEYSTTTPFWLTTATPTQITSPSFSRATNGTNYSVELTASGVTAANAATMNLPNKTQTAYYRCWLNADGGSQIMNAAIADIATTLSSGTGVSTVKGSNAIVASVTAVVGSVVALMAF